MKLSEMKPPLTLLILGGYGTFGGRIAELLEDDAHLTLMIAGRSLARAKAFCDSRTPARARLMPTLFDRDGDAEAQLAHIRPDILVDASGPFQTYGEGCYRVIEACLALRIPYLDLADGSDFVAGVEAYDARAKEAGIFILSGVSSFPVLPAAAVRRMSGDLARVTAIRAGIAPSPHAILGLNVLRAIASYAGKGLMVKKNGRDTQLYPLIDAMRFTIRPPGYLPLGNRLFSLVDVPDLKVLGALWPEAETIWMGAGPAPEFSHRMLIGLAWLVRLGLIKSLSPLAAFIHRASPLLRWGEDRGGMFVAIEGVTPTGTKVKRVWHMLAEGKDGPMIPSMAVEAFIRRALNGTLPPNGARAATRDLELNVYEELFSRRRIVTGIRDETALAGKSLYANLLSSAFDKLPKEVQALHSEWQDAEGMAHITRGKGFLARLAARAMGFPGAGEDVPLRVTFERLGSKEIWTRRFGTQKFSSEHSAGCGRDEGLVCERFGGLSFAMALVDEDDKLSLVLRRWSAFGLPLPMALCPRSEAFETGEDGRFHFKVAISHPLTGPIITYEGWLKAS